MSGWISLAIGFVMLATAPFLWRQRERMTEKSVALWGEGVRASEARRLTAAVVACVLLGILTVAWSVAALLG